MNIPALIARRAATGLSAAQVAKRGAVQYLVDSLGGGGGGQPASDNGEAEGSAGAVFNTPGPFDV